MKKRITPFSRFASKGLSTCSAGMLLVTVAHAANTAAAPAGMDAMVQTVMQAHQIPGMAIAIIQPSKTSYHNYGVASRETGQPVDYVHFHTADLDFGKRLAIARLRSPQHLVARRGDGTYLQEPAARALIRAYGYE